MTLEKNFVCKSLLMLSFSISPCKGFALKASLIECGYAYCVGALGATLGGGVGPYGGLHGLQIDALKSVRMVTGTGSLINVSATSHPDLWWGMRGAGFNFGIVTSATYQVYDFTNNGHAMNADFKFYASQNASLFEFARSYVGRLPDAFAIDIAISYNESIKSVSHLLSTSVIPQKKGSHRLTLPPGIYPCQLHLRWPIRRGHGAHPAVTRSRTLRPKHHHDPLERSRDRDQIRHQRRSLHQGKLS